MDELAAEDYLFICQSRYPSIPSLLLSKLITFNTRLYEDTMVHCKYGQDGSPWEFNLRDVIRSCEIIQGKIVFLFCKSFLIISFPNICMIWCKHLRLIIFDMKVLPVMPCLRAF